MAARKQSSSAVACDGDAGAAATAGTTAGETLARSLWQIQAAAKLKFQFTEPAKLAGYLVGQPITQSRALLEQAAEAILAKAELDELAGITTEFLNTVSAQLTSYTTTESTQSNCDASSKGLRAERDRAVAAADSIGGGFGVAGGCAGKRGEPEVVPPAGQSRARAIARKDILRFG